ncbi:coproporphyrinogen dehydrogenase HemZ [Paramaledivibacter caminithermalis]|jgi:oxygen-independent coproporphyrinogen-3 oxidase|uniref:Oxygen-independent coproporphyrinogen-3 oxidase n=1 Tax=Paramaledivibacter caminithermalis (strain DSM 15212 / CIP 107654 / DViRD3) TaxID=1121301 RepID=A0A1M6JW80_PARC5|nr:coproporphyrinogen dehydrogenase HemZ [Paramaledivibacter caminithermalis]SHJ50967.1 oxygen-independent coproporphyrinogen-3 oxidase [Paramaledivibacter caminithermalis DSM 15212]
MINVTLKGHDYRYEIGELIKAFGIFDNIRFIQENINYDNDYLLINEVIGGEEKDFIYTRIIKDNEVVSIDEKIYIKNSCINDIQERKELKRRIKVSIFDALSKICNINLPWGILTGIRPTKIVHELLDENFSVNEINKVLKNEYRISDEKIKLVTDVALCERKYIYPINEDLVSLYISIPFCPTRCVYCSFPSNPIKEGNKIVEDYLDALYKEIEKTSGLLKETNKKLESVYIGGGTPTTLSSLQLDNLINHLLKAFDVSRLKEFTVEAGRPDTIDIEKLRTLKKNGVDRISINPQTMNVQTLKLIGRKHTPEEIENAFYLAKEVGFKVINMDIIIGLPNEGIEELKNTLEIIKKLSPENLTVHTLAIKKSSKLKEAVDEFEMTKEALAKEMLNLSRNYAHEIGLYPYYMYRQKYMVGNLENVGYCKAGCECLYNMQIMEEKQSIIALGAGAVSKITFPRENRLERIPNVKNVQEYIKRVDEMVERKRKQIN